MSKKIRKTKVNRGKFKFLYQRIAERVASYKDLDKIPAISTKYFSKNVVFALYGNFLPICEEHDVSVHAIMNMTSAELRKVFSGCPLVMIDRIISSRLETDL